MQDCNECKKWKEKEIYYDKKGGITRRSFSKESTKGTAMKVPIKIKVIVKKDSLDELPEIARKVDELRNEQPLTEVHFVVKC